MPRKPRQQFFVNSAVQGSLLCRVAMYWVYCLVAVALSSAVWLVLFNRPASSGELLGQMLGQVVPVLFGTLLVLPIVLLDLVRYSNRFVGPLFRLTRAMDRLADGERVHNIEFRQGDFWFHIAQTFNRLNERTIRLEQQLKAAETRVDEEASVDVTTCAD